MITQDRTAEIREARIDFLDKVISQLPEEEAREESPKKACRNCYNLGATLIHIGMYWAERRCHYCHNYDNWSHVRELRDEIAKGEPLC